jgi:DNA repair protein RecN (Recombination protein N)
MLVQLTIRNVALIEQLVIEPASGFNAITGETGAGKSIILDALGLALGGRAQPEILRTGEREAEVEALFEVAPSSRVAARLEAAGIPCSGEVLVRRTVQLDGDRGVRSRAFVNGRLSTAAQLAELATDLCDIASQHESVSLTDPATHLSYLDAFGGLEADRSVVAEEVDALVAATRELDGVRAAERDRAEREDFLGFQLREIEELDPKPGEENDLEHERARLRHAEKLTDVTRRAAERLYEGEAAICDELGRLAADLDGAATIDPALGPVGTAVDTARAELADAARALARYAEGIEANPARLGEVEERLFRLQKLLRKHGPTTEELAATRARLSSELAGIGSVAERVVMLEERRAATFARVSQLVRALSRKRRAVADELADAIGRELGQLGMGRARVVVEVAPAPARADRVPTGDAPDLVVDGARVGRTGIDRVEFLIAPNRGEDPRPLRKIASGGELSRALLAVKRVLAEEGPAGTYVFDEVDAGVGGAIAEVIGRSIADVARHRQVLCITHLPQIAALADAHFVVGKTEQRNRTVTHVRRLTDEEREGEIARMIGGVKVGQAARRAAAEMLKKG